jgi:dihydropteroate synthase
MTPTAAELAALDNQLSKRFIELDPDGYFLIYLDHDAGLICAKHFTNVINDKGLACDPATTTLFAARTAKELCIKIFEENKPAMIRFPDHAAYLGREFVRAEVALVNGAEYIQD